MNPTNDVLEKRVAALEGGLAALTVGSGQAASTFAIMNVCQSGDNFISSTDLYGGTVNLFRLTLPKFGIKTPFVKPRDTEGFKKATLFFIFFVTFFVVSIGPSLVFFT